MNPQPQEIAPWLLAPGLHAVAVLVALALAAACLRAARRPDDTKADLGLATLVALAAAAWLSHVHGGPWTGHDQTTGLLLAQDCLQRDTCHLTSVDSGIRGFTNGALWPHLLTVVAALHGTAATLRGTLVAFAAVSAGLVFLTSWRWLRPAVALPAAVFAVAGFGAGGGPSAGPGDPGPSNLVDASAACLPTALFACALLVFVRTRRTPALLLAAVFASHAMNTHVAGAALVPGLVAAAALAGRWPVPLAALALATHAATTLVTSPAALAVSLSHIDRSERIAIASGIAVLVAVCRVAHPRFVRAGPALRSAVVGAALVLPVAAAAAMLLRDHREFSPRYLAPVIAPLAMMAGALAAALPSLAARALPALRPAAFALPPLAAMAALFAVEAPPPPRVWTYDDGRVVAAALRREGACYDRVFGRLQTPQCTPVTYAVMPYACFGGDDLGALDDRRAWRAWLAPGGELPALPHNARVLPVAGGDRVVLSAVDSWIDTSDIEVCTTPDLTLGDAVAPRTCHRPEAPDAAPFLFSRRLQLGYGDAYFQPPFRMVYTLALRPTPGAPRLLWLPDGDVPLPRDPSMPPPNAARAHCGWQVTAVTGVLADRPLPANPVRLSSPEGAPASVVVERLVGAPDCFDPFPGQQLPCVWEATPDDPAWMQDPTR